MRAVDLLDTETLERRAQELHDMLSEGEINTWKEHPCTKMLMYGLLIDEAYILQGWKSGAYPDQRQNDQAIGHLKAIQQLKTFFGEEIAIDQDDRS